MTPTRKDQKITKSYFLKEIFFLVNKYNKQVDKVYFSFFDFYRLLKLDLKNILREHKFLQENIFGINK